MAEFTREEGLREVAAALRALPREFASKNGGPIRRALFKASKPIRDDAQRRAPRLTGNLAANVYIRRDPDPQRRGAAERYSIGVRTAGRRRRQMRVNNALGKISRTYRARGDAYYWRFIEFGTSRQRAKPFMRPAYEAGKRRAVETFVDVVKRGTTAAVRRARKAAGVRR